MNLAVGTLLLVLSAVLSCALGGVVLFRNRTKRTHQHFALLSLNLTLWALGVVAIIHAETSDAALFWLRLTFIVASFLPATFYHFIVYFPNQRFEGVRLVLGVLYVGAVFQIVGSFTPWYVQEISFEAGGPPLVRYGPVFTLYTAWALLSTLFSFTNLVRKVRTATGVERRQVEHVLIGIFLTTLFGGATNILAPVMNVGSLEPYGPVFTMLMMGMLAYAMIRYHLLDIWLLVSRTTIYAIVTVFVVTTFLGTVSLVHWVFSSGGRTGSIITTVLASLVIALVLQPLKERLQLFAERRVLKRNYDVNRVCARITQEASRIVRLDQLLGVVAGDIRATMGVEAIRVLLVDEKDVNLLVTEYSSVPNEPKTRTRDHQALLEHLCGHPEPLLLKKLLHERHVEETMMLARHLAELDAFLCLPLRASSGMVGVLTLGEKTSGDIYSVDDLAVLTTVAGPLGTAIENARLYLKVEQVNMHLAGILTNMRGGVVAVDAQGQITTINASATEMLGPVSVGQPMDVLQEQVAYVLRRTLREARGTGDFETVILGPDGEKVPVIMSSSCLESPANARHGAMVMIHNQTQVKRLEQNVQRADRLSSIGTLAAGMAHEVKNPLVSIKTFTQLLPTRFDDADFRRTFSEVVPHEVDRIDSIVSRLLDFARPKPPHFGQYDLRIIIEQILALVENQTRKAGIMVEQEFPPGPVMVYGDDQQLRQVFLNLFLNAIDALKKTTGGSISVKTYYDRAYLRRKDLPPFVESECVRIVVADTGSGISRENIQRLFTPFFTTKPEGCGLGLSVVHGIVTEHGGEIDVNSAPGEGTAFTLTLPVPEAMAASVHAG